MALDDYLDIEGKRLQVELTRSEQGDLIVKPSEELGYVYNPVRITEGKEKITGSIPDHRVMVELTGHSEARLVSTFDINREL